MEITPIIPATVEAEAEDLKFEASQGTSWQDPISKTSWAW
jgi:hypothetical protein